MSQDSPPLAAVILAAGKSTRMNMRAKATIDLAGRPIGRRVLDAVQPLSPARTIVVVGHQAAQVKEVFGPSCEFVLQQPQLGTAHALQTAQQALADFSGTILLVNADHPLIATDDLRRLCDHHHATAAAATMLSFNTTPDSAYGRVLRDAAGRVTGIVEARDASPEQLAINEVNLLMFCLAAPHIFEILARIRPDNAQSEYYLTDAVALLVQEGARVEALPAQHPGTGFGINTPEELARAQAHITEGSPLY